MSERRSMPDFFWPGIIVSAAAVYGYVTYQPPLTSARPESPPADELPTPPLSAEIPGVHARLWEDPLAAANRHHANNKTTQSDWQRIQEMR